jgi:hypothetical protein
MPPNGTPLLLELYESQAGAAAQVFESWRQATGEPAVRAQEVTDLIAELADGPKRVERVYRTAWDRLFDRRHNVLLNRFVEIGEAVFRYWDEQLALLRSVRDLAQSLVERGESVPNLPALGAAIDKLDRGRGRAYNGWPWFRPEDEAAALAEHARGESLSIEDVFGVLPRPHP